jgi:carbon storage regulator
MLVLGRREGETLEIDGRIKVTVLVIRGRQIHLGIEAPREVAIRRSEVPIGSERIGGKAKIESANGPRHDAGRRGEAAVQ